jgi:predicted 3-demethylubiquinone-9 3-methyltransferase (glyoxalase superfamily)
MEWKFSSGVDSKTRKFMAITQKIKSHLWFDRQAEEAVSYYTSIFRNSTVLRTSHYGKEGFEVHKMPEGTVLTIEFQIEGQTFIALNGGPEFKFTEAVSFLISCKDQQEIDYYWEKLTRDGDPGSQQCGWLKDKYGVFWQVVPERLSEMLADSDREKTDRLMKVFLKMKKIDLKKLEEAYEGEMART